MRFTAHVTQEGTPSLQHRSYKKLTVLLVAVLLVIASIATVAFILLPNNQLANPLLISQETAQFPLGNNLHVDHNQTTGIMVDISGKAIPADMWFTVNTSRMGTDVPKDAGAPLAIQGRTPSYFDVKVTTNETITPDMMVRITVTNDAFDNACTMYYWNTTQAKWVSVQTLFYAPHSVVGYLPASALTGTPIGVVDDTEPTPSPTPMYPTPTMRDRVLPKVFVVDEYALGALVAIIVSFAAFGLFAVQKRTNKQQ